MDRLEHSIHGRLREQSILFKDQMATLFAQITNNGEKHGGLKLADTFKLTWHPKGPEQLLDILSKSGDQLINHYHVRQIVDAKGRRRKVKHKHITITLE